jgi:hypothetical protein
LGPRPASAARKAARSWRVGGGVVAALGEREAEVAEGEDDLRVVVAEGRGAGGDRGDEVLARGRLLLAEHGVGDAEVVEVVAAQLGPSLVDSTRVTRPSTIGASARTSRARCRRAARTKSRRVAIGGGDDRGRWRGRCGGRR